MTDLDGTLIPRANSDQDRESLRILTEQLRLRRVILAFATGRSLESVIGAIEKHMLPEPDWIIGDVGTTIWKRGADQRELAFTKLKTYDKRLQGITSQFPIGELRGRLCGIGGLCRQELKKQGCFKLSYYTQPGQLTTVVEAIQRRLDEYAAPYSIVHGVDPITRQGLIDLLPRGVSKAYALNWWTEHACLAKEAIVYAGDSRNDLAAAIAGYRTIIVGNAGRAFVREVRRAHRIAGWSGRLHLADAASTSGLLDGCRRLGLLPS